MQDRVVQEDCWKGHTHFNQERAAMLRGEGPCQVRRWAWSETWQETEAVAEIQTMDTEQQEDQTTTEISDMEAEVDYVASSQPASEAEALSSATPSTGDSFCQCHEQEELSPGFDCLCGEEDQSFDWVWDERLASSGALLSCDSRKASFHSDYSCGTAAVRGTKELSDGQHFWEIKMTSPVYGTDMMVGIGTKDVNLEKFKYNFGSLLGHDEESLGLSYTGLFQQKGDKVDFSSRFGQGSIIGVHLDTWHGTLTFYKNRRRIGVAATRLKNKYYPMVCSTAAKSSMKVTRACYTPTSLQYLCCARLRQTLPDCPDVLAALELPPGLHNLLQAQLGWVFTLSNSSSSSSPEPSEQHRNLPEDLQDDITLPPSPCLSPSPLPCHSPCPSPLPCLSPSPCSSPIPSPVSTLSACSSLSPCSSPCPDAVVSYLCPCQMSAQIPPCTCHCPPTPPSSDYDSSEPEDYQSKRCRWT